MGSTTEFARQGPLVFHGGIPENFNQRHESADCFNMPFHALKMRFKIDISC